MQTKQLIFRIILFILLLLLLIQIIFSKGFSSCDKCSFKFEGKKIRTAQLLDIYEDKCFSEKLGYNPIINENQYPGPVPEGYDEEYFRKTGETRLINYSNLG